jgi:hypothetical protein
MDEIAFEQFFAVTQGAFPQRDADHAAELRRDPPRGFIACSMVYAIDSQ